MNIIQINDNWKIDISDKHNYRLVQYIPPRPKQIINHKLCGGGDYWKPLESFHKNLKQALNKIIEIEMLEQHGDTCSIQEWLDKLDTLYSKYSSFLKS